MMDAGTNAAAPANVAEGALGWLLPGGKRKQKRKRLSARQQLQARNARLKVAQVLSLMALLTAWELITFFRVVDPLFLPSPAAVAQKAVRLVNSGELLLDIEYSFKNFGVSFALAVLVGIPAGLGLGAYKTADSLISPYIWMLHAMPRIALMPLIIIWLGFGVQSRVLLMFWMAVFPIIVNTAAGVKTVDPTLIKAVKCFGAKGPQIFSKVVLPHTVSFVMTGLRMGVNSAWHGLIVAELFGSSKGLGYLTMSSGNNFDTAGLFVGLIILVTLSVSSVNFMGWLEHRMSNWRSQVIV